MSTVDPPIPLATATGFLSEPELAAIRHELGHYENPRAACIEALKAVQSARGWVPDPAIPAIAELLGITPADVEGVATFYNMIFRQPVGRHVIKVCDSIACYLTGYEELAAAVRTATGLDWGQTGADGRFTLLPVCCLGNCDKGPSLMIDDDTWGPLSAAEVPALLERYL
ncbi:MAG: NADH-quinone oxidoreductase subunit E [Pseudomonadales bacterium]|nr:NADH-quinone oxidoreductase subunit E [Pseudomonadales bacterium]